MLRRCGDTARAWSITVGRKIHILGEKREYFRCPGTESLVENRNQTSLQKSEGLTLASGSAMALSKITPLSQILLLELLLILVKQKPMYVSGQRVGG